MLAIVECGKIRVSKGATGGNYVPLVVISETGNGCLGSMVAQLALA